MKTLVITLVAVLALASTSSAQEPPTHDVLMDRAWEGLYKASVHVRYHHGYAQWWGGWERVVSLFVLVFTILGLSGPYVFKKFAGKQNIAKVSWYVVASASAISGLALNIVPLSEWRNSHSVLHQRWNLLAGEWEKLYGGITPTTDAQITSRIEELIDQEKAIEGAEPSGYNERYLVKCQEAENRFRRLEIKDTPPITAALLPDHSNYSMACRSASSLAILGSP